MAQLPFALAGKRVWVAGHSGMVGRALVRRLEREDCTVVTAEHGTVDLRRQTATETWLRAARPQIVIVAAARVGGILANDSRPAEFLYDNLAIATNVIHAAYEAGVEKLLFLGSSCIYPKDAPQPIKESELLKGPLEATNQWYAVAKIAGVKLCESYRRQFGADFISALPTNLYGPHDNFDLAGAHVLPALLRKAHFAKLRGESRLDIWGTGRPRREFLHVDDCADGLVFLLKHYSDTAPVNLGSGSDVSIAELARLIAAVVGFAGEPTFDSTKPDGVFRKLLDTRVLESLGWSPSIPLLQGIEQTYAWLLANQGEFRGAVDDGQGLQSGPSVATMRRDR